MIKLIDHYSGGTVNFQQIVAQGYTGIIFKAGQGAWADVPRYKPDWWQQAKDAGLMRGWYWLSDSRYKSADHLKEMDKWKLLDDLGELGLWLDVEKGVISWQEKDYNATPYKGYRNVVDLAYLLMQRNVKPGIYTGPGAYELIFRGAPQSAHDYMSQFDLWTAQYPYVYVPGVSKPTMYGSWKTWTLWQYREGPDINIFNGTDEQFFEKFKATAPTIPPIGEDNMITATVSTSGLNFRSTPSAVSGTNILLPSLALNDKLEGDLITPDNWLHVTKVNGVSRVGYVAAWLLSNVVTSTPPTTPSEDLNVVINQANGVVTVSVNGVAYHEA